MHIFRLLQIWTVAKIRRSQFHHSCLPDLLLQSYEFIWGVPKMGDPQVTMGFNMCQYENGHS